jgi:hypothetical protein
MFCAQIYSSHNSVPVQYYTIVLLYLLLLYTMQYDCIIDMTEYNSNGIVSLKMLSEVLMKLGQGILNCCLYFNLKMFWTRN